MSTRITPTRRRTPCTVLVVDDHEEARHSARVVLEHFGFVVREACTGLGALVIAQITQPRVILLDVVLPEIDGPQLARMLRADPTVSGTAIIAMSAIDDVENRARSLAAGCDEFLAKPIAPV